jgi:hypothetical protein
MTGGSFRPEVVEAAAAVRVAEEEAEAVGRAAEEAAVKAVVAAAAIREASAPSRSLTAPRQFGRL